MSTSKGSVLLVDDDPDIREAIRDTLADEGYQSIEVSNGKEALDYLHANPAPPLILLDWNMTPINGPQFMLELAKDPALARIPVILLTADAYASEKMKTAHFVGHLKKPVDLNALFAVVGQYCG